MPSRAPQTSKQSTNWQTQLTDHLLRATRALQQVWCRTQHTCSLSRVASVSVLSRGGGSCFADFRQFSTRMCVSLVFLGGCCFSFAHGKLRGRRRCCLALCCWTSEGECGEKWEFPGRKIVRAWFEQRGWSLVMVVKGMTVWDARQNHGNTQIGDHLLGVDVKWFVMGEIFEWFESGVSSGDN